MRKHKSIPTMRKLRVIHNGNIYYTRSDWETKEIDGMIFVYVIKSIGIRETPKLMRKDYLEVVNDST